MMIAILILAAVFIALTGIGFLFGAQAGILIAYLGKPIIDATWSYNLGPINALKIVGVLLPIMVFGHVLAAGPKARNAPLLPIWLIYTVYTCLSYGFQLVYTDNPVDDMIGVVQLTFRTLNGLAAYLMLQTFFRDEKQFRRLILFLLLAGLFPMLTGIYQAATGVVWRERMTVGLARSVGLYHDAFSFRAYAFQTLTAVILYWAYCLKRHEIIKRALLIGLSVMALVVLYKVYSKAGVLILVLWILIWSAGRRSLVPALFIVGGLLLVNLAANELLFAEVKQLFSKELVVTEGSANTFAEKQTLGGRWFIWDYYLNQYWQSSLLEQVFGTGRAVAAHNDFLGRLIASGVLGVILYALLLWTVGVRLVQNYFRQRTPLSVMGLMVFTMWMVDTIGLAPSMYTSYQWYAWGIMGLALRGLDSEQPEAAKGLVAENKLQPKGYFGSPSTATREGNRPQSAFRGR